MSRIVWVGCLVLILILNVGASAQQTKEQIPDAPSASQPPQPLPPSEPATAPEATPEKKPDNTAPTDGSTELEPPPKPPANIKTVPEGGATEENVSSTADLFTLSSNVNQVIVPVMVKDQTGQMVNGLLPKDFAVFENGTKQKMNFFSSDPLALSAAVVFDLGMADIAVQKVNQTFSALEGAFSQFDEVSVYTYSSSVSKAADFSTAGKRLTAVLNDLKNVRGRNSGPPITGGPYDQRGPIINGRPLDPGAPTVVTPPKESRVLNDAILAAAVDLRKRGRDRRKIIFIVSDGREYRSNASYSDVLKVLLSNGIIVYAVGVEGAAIPIYGQLQKLRLPKIGGTGNILPKYASATGGDVFPEFSRDAIESAYSKAFGEARSQYTIGYVTRATPSGSYREIEVKVARPDCSNYAPPCVRTIAKAGYYPLPPARQ